MGNDYGRPKDVVGETRQLFTSPADTAFDVCFENLLTGHSKLHILSSRLKVKISEKIMY
jgi:hypothetical protein